jgi:type VI secretion system protein VasD
MKLFSWLKPISIVLAMAAVTGCTSLNSKVGGVFNMDTDLVLRFKADADINPDDKKRPSPLFLRLYELKSTKQFARANFIDLYERDSEVLGADMVAKQTLKRLKPGDERKDSFVLKPETRYVGLVAEFLQYRDAKFKIVIPVARTNVFATSADVRLSGNSLTLAKDAASEETGPEDINADKR